MLAIFIPSAQLDSGSDKCREGKTHPFAAKVKVTPCGLQKLKFSNKFQTLRITKVTRNDYELTSN